MGQGLKPQKTPIWLRNDGLNVITGVKAQSMCNVANKEPPLRL